VVSSTNGDVDYHECLLRMIDEEGRVIAAGAFVPAIEQLGFIRVIDRHVLETAVEELGRKRNPDEIRAAVAEGYACLR